MVSIQGKSLLGLQGVPKEEIELILRVAKKMKAVVNSGNKKLSLLKGKSVVNMFWEPSTRTRGSFEMAAKYLGADVINFTPRGSSIQKGESFRDTLLTVTAMGVDAIVMRQKQEGSPWFADRCVDPIIINAGDGAHEHPTQGLLDMFTIKEVKGHIDGLKVVIVGDIDHGRVARSNIYGLKTMGADVHLVGPRTLLQPELEAMGVKVHYDLKEAIQDADVINVLRIQKEFALRYQPRSPEMGERRRPRPPSGSHEPGHRNRTGYLLQRIFFDSGTGQERRVRPYGRIISDNYGRR